jgi:hypothetical protein
LEMILITKIMLGALAPKKWSKTDYTIITLRAAVGELEPKYFWAANSNLTRLFSHRQYNCKQQ